MSDIMTKEAHRRLAVEDYQRAKQLLWQAWEHHKKTGTMLNNLDRSLKAQTNLKEALDLIEVNLAMVFKLKS